MQRKSKIAKGQFFTRQNAWLKKPILDFICKYMGEINVFVDPFAGEGHMLNQISQYFDVPTHGYDIDSPHFPHNDSLKNIPFIKNQMIITNPPYLAKHSAVRKNVYEENKDYFQEEYDLYMLAIKKCLEVSERAVMVIPETFISSKFPKNHLDTLVVLEDSVFTDTEMPVCVCCFDKNKLDGHQNAKIFSPSGHKICISELERKKFKPKKDVKIVFNDPNGKIALKAVDGTQSEDLFRFLRVEDFGYAKSKILESSRLMTYVHIPSLADSDVDTVVQNANKLLGKIREETNDLIFSAFKNNNKDGIRRRRLDYSMARYVLEKSLAKNNADSSKNFELFKV